MFSRGNFSLALLTSATLFLKTHHVRFHNNAQLNNVEPRDGRGEREAPSPQWASDEGRYHGVRIATVVL